MKETRLQNKVQLITYPDSLGGNLQGLNTFLQKYIQDAVGGVHILPFFPSSSDRGFSPISRDEVDSRFGTWEDIEGIASRYDVVSGAVVNHISAESTYMNDYLAHGDSSAYKGLFIDIDQLLKSCGEGIDCLKEVSRPRTTSLSTPFRLYDGSVRNLWTTFSSDQVDLNYDDPIAKEFFVDTIKSLSSRGVKLVRLDAVGYIAKEPKTSCFLIPKTFELLTWMKGVAEESNVEILSEVHAAPERVLSLIEQGATHWVYDFALPLLTLHGLKYGDATHIKEWIERRSNKMITVLDTHDGIGINDVRGMLPKEEIKGVVRDISHSDEANLTRIVGGVEEVYQVNTTFYSALQRDEDSYILARAIQFFLPGIPQVYYVGLLAGENDVAYFEETGDGRSLNRHNYSEQELEQASKAPVVQRLIELMKFRNTHPAFCGEMRVKESDESTLNVEWKHEDEMCVLKANLAERKVVITYTEDGQEKTFRP